ncbi:MAG TPA: hypothetical protein VNV85_14950 [Puia sp.]|jgi:hypothetical protein|nr:hypothetical protein [Puia sp.]
MYNPFPLLSETLLDEKIKSGKRFFVRQTFPRGMQPRLRAAFLFRAYEWKEEQLAKEHMQLLTRDANAFLYDAEDLDHLKRMKQAAKQPHGFKIFYAGKKGVEWEPPKDYQEKMKAYIRQMHPNWRTKKDGEKIAIGLFEEFGELFLKFSFENQQDKLPFDEIEKY